MYLYIVWYNDWVIRKNYYVYKTSRAAFRKSVRECLNSTQTKSDGAVGRKKFMTDFTFFQKEFYMLSEINPQNTLPLNCCTCEMRLDLTPVTFFFSLVCEVGLQNWMDQECKLLLCGTWYMSALLRNSSSWPQDRHFKLKSLQTTLGSRWEQQP